VTRGSWTAFVALLVFTMGTSIVTPLLPLYQDRYDLSNGEITLLFATYTFTVVPTMLVMGNVSDRIGRKRVMFPAMASLLGASLVLGLTGSVPLLFVGRVLQGLAIGGFLGVGTALVVDHAVPARRAFVATIAGLGFRLGFGLGPGLAGVVAEYSSGDPLQRPFQGHAILMGIAVLAVLLTPETIHRHRLGRIKIRVGVPPGQLAAFATFLAPAVFLMSFLDATLLSVVPLYMADTLDVDNLALIGLVGFLILGAGGFTPLFAGRVPPRSAVMAGVAAASLSSLLIVTASSLGAVAPVLIAAGVIGLLNGLILQGATTICGVSVPLEERGKLMSALYMCAYSGTVPTVGLGYLSSAIGLTAALVVASAVAIGIASFVLAVGTRHFRAVIPYVEPPRERPLPVLAPDAG
jgi:MFS family permease